MKKLILSLILISALSSGYTQTLTLKEMIEQTKCTTFSCFNDFLLQKGFSYKSIDSKCCNGNVYTYESDIFFDTVGKSKFKTISQFMIQRDEKNKYNFISLLTRGKLTYLKFLEELKANGFKISQEAKNDYGFGGMEVYYTSNSYNNIDVRVSVSNVTTETGDSFTNYFISVVRYF